VRCFASPNLVCGESRKSETAAHPEVSGEL
jgi:hypothetical protein